MKHHSQAHSAGQQAGHTDRESKDFAELDFRIDPAEIDRHIAAAQRMRAQMVAEMLKAAFSWLSPSQRKGAKPEGPSPQSDQALPV